VTLAEGLPGTRKPILERLLRRGLTSSDLAVHQQIDEEKDHSLIARSLVACFPHISKERAALAIRRFLVTAEISQRIWAEIAAYAAAADAPVPPTIFGMDRGMVDELGRVSLQSTEDFRQEAVEKRR
jgi:hypothetical protein